MKEILNSIKMFALLTVLCGIIYPIFVTIAAGILFADKSRGSIVTVNGKNVGSELLAQKFTSPQYFWPRPSACDWQTMPSAASNLSIFDAGIKNNIRMYKERYVNTDYNAVDEMMFASASGLDPHISPRNAFAQAERICKERGIAPQLLKALIQKNTEGRTLGFLGEERVNVLKLNLALDNYEK